MFEGAEKERKLKWGGAAEGSHNRPPWRGKRFAFPLPTLASLAASDLSGDTLLCSPKLLGVGGLISLSKSEGVSGIRQFFSDCVLRPKGHTPLDPPLSDFVGQEAYGF